MALNLDGQLERLDLPPGYGDSVWLRHPENLLSSLIVARARGCEQDGVALHDAPSGHLVNVRLKGDRGMSRGIVTGPGQASLTA